MRVRAGIILIENDSIALIKRVQGFSTFYVLPGGSVADHENTRQATIRKAKEELGVNVEISRMLAVVEISKRGGHWLQIYYLVQKIGGEFGKTKKAASKPKSFGSYEAVWMPVKELTCHSIYPKPLAYLLAKQVPNEVLHITESKALGGFRDKSARVIETHY
ncbi:MAG: NUDIX domain-containing protein [Trueperaceae bacterium]|nr:NUDIX domain-containing protein [Trueperaceae bacterium]